MTYLNLKIDLKLSNFNLCVDYQQYHTGITAIIGKSGSGKSTLLKAIAGLFQKGNIYLSVEDKLWQCPKKGRIIPPHKRSIAYLFQDAPIIDFLTPFENLTYGYKRLRHSSIPQTPHHLIREFGLENIMKARSIDLSGGERQKLALARGMLTRPKIWLMDEPLSAVDQNDRHRLINFFQQVLGTTKCPCYYVSHEADEVSRIANFVMLIDHGEIQFHGTLAQAKKLALL